MPNCFARLRAHGHNETVAATRALLDELLVVLVVTKNDFVLVNDGRGAAAVLADERAKVALPNRFAVVIQGCEPVMLRFVPNHVNSLGVHGRRRSGITIVLMPWKRREWKIAPPDEFPGLRTQAEHGKAAGLVAGARKENAVPPEDGRGMSGGRQLDLPIDVRVTDFCGDAFVITDARAVWPAEAGPFLRGVVGSERGKADGNQGRRQKCFHFTANGWLSEPFFARERF